MAEEKVGATEEQEEVKEAAQKVDPEDPFGILEKLKLRPMSPYQMMNGGCATMPSSGSPGSGSAEAGTGAPFLVWTCPRCGCPDMEVPLRCAGCGQCQGD